MVHVASYEMVLTSECPQHNSKAMVHRHNLFHMCAIPVPSLFRFSTIFSHHL